MNGTLVILICVGAIKGITPTSIDRIKDRPTQQYKPHTVGEVWTMETNFGGFGDPMASTTGNPSYDWPGGSHYYYLWEGGLWIGVRVDGEAYVTTSGYLEYEWMPSDPAETGWGDGWGYIGPDVSMYDINSVYDDWGDWNESRAIGLRVYQRALQWSIYPYSYFIAYEYKITYDKSKSALPSPPDVLEDVYVAFRFDADVCSYDPTDCHIDDYVCYDGWTNGEWKDLEHHPSPTDEYTILADTTLPMPDGIPDQYGIFGDDPYERTLNGDTLIIPRNMSYIYDADHPATSENDEGEGGGCPGYIFGRIIYAPPSPADSFWIDKEGRECRLIRPWSHQWWNWNNDPGDDENKLEYMTATHPMSLGHRFLPHPEDVGAGPFDYRFLLTGGPYDIPNGDTIYIVYVAGVGYGLNGGYDEVFGKGWVPGARQIADYALAAYYMGSVNSDPVHPSAPNEDFHWVIPVPPPVPELHYSVRGGAVHLVWSNIAEITPDPVDGMYDFAGYRVYRSAWKVGNWELLADFDTAYAREHGGYPHSYVDTTALMGIPYYYAVTAYDLGRPADSISGRPEIPSLESGKTNYMKDEKGAEIAVIIEASPASLEDVETLVENIKVIPNPYYGSASWEPEYKNKIMFTNLPTNCIIKIYTLSGDLVQEIVHRGPTGSAWWNLRSKYDIEVASGVYIYKVEIFDENGEYVTSKVGKIVILR
ncbi:hypothetical protein DRQ20_00120 [bacterium]|nr:MAG: hypothetical protein DRQ20_00120 [bacterium]